MIMPDVAALMQRLLSDDTATRLAAQQEAQAWSPQTLLAVLEQHWPEGYDLPVPKPSGLLEKWRHLLPTDPPEISAALDVLVILHAEASAVPESLGPLLSVLARTEERRRQLHDKSHHHRPFLWSPPYMHLHIQGSDLTRTALNRIHAALGRLLPTLTFTHCALSSTQRKALLLPLRLPYHDVDFTLKLLAFLARQGDTGCLPLLKTLARNALPTENGQRIHAAATACLEQIGKE